MPELFSRRNKLRDENKLSGLIYDYVPIEAFTGFIYIFHDFIQFVDDVKFIKEYCESYRIPHETYKITIEKDKKIESKLLKHGLKHPNGGNF